LSIEVGALQTNAYIFFNADSRGCFIIDPGADGERIKALIAGEGLLPRAVVLTHAHADHVGAVSELTRHFQIPLWVHAAEAGFMHGPLNREIAALFVIDLPPAADRLLADGENLSLDGLELQVIHSPGHTPGSILLYGDGLLFTGDTLFRGDVGRTDLPGGDEDEMRSSLEKFRSFPPRTVILPGHGPRSVLEHELKTNPYL
jgi:glyoxylase-like metal-dependent hydrolase (beta-lactamase superfamily II)